MQQCVGWRSDGWRWERWPRSDQWSCKQRLKYCSRHAPQPTPCPAPTIGVPNTVSFPFGPQPTQLSLRDPTALGPESKGDHYLPVTLKATEPGVRHKGFEGRCDLVSLCPLPSLLISRFVEIPWAGKKAESQGWSRAGRREQGVLRLRTTWEGAGATWWNPSLKFGGSK